MDYQNDIIIHVHFFDCKESVSYISRQAYGHGACHVGLSFGNKIIFPIANKPLKIREAGVIYALFKPQFTFSLLGREKDPMWYNKYEGDMIDSALWRLITEPIYVLKDAGLQVNTPKRRVCVDIITDCLRDLGIDATSRTPHGLLKELEGSPYRIG